MTSPTAPAFQPKSGMRFVTLLTLVTLAHVLVIVLILAHFGWLAGVGVETDDHAGQSGIVIPVTLETVGDEEKQIEEKVEPEAETAPESVPESKSEPTSEPTQAQEHTQEPAPRSPETTPSAEPAADTSTQNNTDVEKEIPLTVESDLPPASPPAPVLPTPAISDAPSSPSSNASRSASSSTSKNTSSEVAQIKMESDSLPITPAQVDPNYLHRPDPVYPALSKRFRETGTVLLRVSLDATGAVRDVAVQTSSEYQRLDQAALEAVRQWRFIPASRGPQPIPSTVLVPIEFKHQ